MLSISAREKAQTFVFRGSRTCAMRTDSGVRRPILGTYVWLRRLCCSRSAVSKISLKLIEISWFISKLKIDKNGHFVWKTQVHAGGACTVE